MALGLFQTAEREGTPARWVHSLSVPSGSPRFEDKRRGKGKRGGLRVIYYFWDGGQEFWMFTLYSKGELADLSAAERKAFKALLENELFNRSKPSQRPLKIRSQRGNK